MLFRSLGVLALCIVRGGWEKTLAPLAWMLCLGAETSGALPWLSAALRHRSAQWFGGISYSLYLVNEPIQKLLGIGLAHLAHRDAWIFAALWLPLAFALPIAAAALCWRWIEQPFLRKPSQPRTSRL